MLLLSLRKEKCSSSNYRAVSLIVNLCKVLESIVRDMGLMGNISKYINKLKGHLQHGFVKNKSCLTNMLVFMEEVTNYLDSGPGYPVDVIYLDFQKAFDKVPHRRLIMRLALSSTRNWRRCTTAGMLDWKLVVWQKTRGSLVLNGQFLDCRDVLSA